MESGKNKQMYIIKQKQTHTSRKQTSGYPLREGRGKGHGGVRD